jgi:predicted O-methyltransferase YrrM
MGGPVYLAIMEKAGQLSFVQDYVNGRINQAAFRQELALNRDKLESLGLDEYWADLLYRFPNDQWRGARQMAEALSSRGIIPTPAVDEQGFMNFENRVGRLFGHLPDRFTSIFPEETRIAYTLSSAIKPSSVFVAGSYYGYLAVWLTPGLAANGKMICSDVDPVVCALAERNMAALGEGGRVIVKCEDAEKLLQNDSSPIDIFVLDAYGGFGHPDPGYHGKAIYEPLLNAALPRLHEKSIVLVHNAEHDAKELDGFFRLVENAKLSLFLNTTENMAVYQF